uniref:C2H2-type domain-containing protein n=1 Tax=Talaromyces rugulosus TaxID=121627 RepID=A0A7H8QN97_TALRU|nr:uncharacterized protein TRUGW13939_02424 [Talaromyces rugulosus]QKX55332.1 hypothetical protein TRUGW13939_02424 [Talaromyces rugulosus]
MDPYIQPHKLFYYSPTYRVVICTSCRYAVQPAAIARHLKEIHHIYRSQRRPFIAYTESLILESPEKVRPPPPEDFPVPHLPVHQGWRCQAPRCGYLCISTKRMQSHWPAKHRCKGDRTRDWIAVPLQTFFRGSLLSYFTKEPSLRQQASVAMSFPSVTDDGELVTKFPYIKKLQRQYELDYIGTSILEHYFDATYKTFVTNHSTEQIWLDIVPTLAYDNPFLLHGILACTSLHMAYIFPAHRHIYNLQACSHQSTALPLFRFAIDHPTEQNCDSIVVFAHLLVIYSFASDTDSSNYSLFLVDDDSNGNVKNCLAIPQWLHFIRAGCSMLCDVWDKVENGPVSALAATWEDEIVVHDKSLPYMKHFLALIPGDSSWSSESISTYRNAATSLAESFAYLDSKDMESSITTWNVLGAWPLRIEDAYVDLLHERHPGALVLLAYYCIILKKLEKFWYFEGRAVKLISSIAGVLDERWHPSIQEAFERVIG